MKTQIIFLKEINKLEGLYQFSKIKYTGKKVERHLNLLRELIFVRSISALEVFLIDNIKEIFALTKEPFKDCEGFSGVEKINILSSKSLSQLHSIIISNICRRLSSQGYSEIEKFYIKYFQISLSELTLGLNINLDKYYEDRHLLVHKLGKTDKKYRTKFNTDIPQIELDEKYIKRAFRDFIKFGRILASTIDSKISILSSSDENRFERIVKLSIFRIKESDILKKNYSFWLDEKFIDINDILLEFLKISDNHFEVVLGGGIKEVSGIMKKIKQEKRKELINYEIIQDSTQIKNPFRIKKISLTKSQIELIKEKLPPQPWPKAIHKKIASEINVPNGQVSAVIQYFIKEGIFRQQIDGEVIETPVQVEENQQNAEKLMGAVLKESFER